MLSDRELPPLPNKEKLHTVLPDDYRYGHIYGYTADQMREYARAVEKAAYEAAIKACAPTEDDDALDRQTKRECVVAIESLMEQPK